MEAEEKIYIVNFHDRVRGEHSEGTIKTSYKRKLGGSSKTES
jgi:hypothetical protein